MSVREADKSDLPIILELMNHAILNGTSIYEREPRNHSYIEKWFSQKEGRKFPILVYEINGGTVAFGTYGDFRKESAYGSSVEHSIHVHQDFQGKGIGKQLLWNLIECAKNEGYHAMIAAIDSGNSKSLQFHAEMGFQEKGRFPEIAFKRGKWLDLVLMQLILTQE